MARISPADDISRLLEGTAGKTRHRSKSASIHRGPTRAKSPSRPSRAKRSCAMKPGSKRNRRKVDELSGGKLAYVYMPDTAQGGLTTFTRYYFAQTDKQGAVIDERYNSGGQVADYVINVLNRPLMGWWCSALGPDLSHPRRSGLRAQGDDHQRICRFRRRCDAVDVSPRANRHARR